MITSSNRETLGAAALRVRKDYNPDQTVIDTQRHMQKDHLEELMKCAKNAEVINGKEDHFYLCVQTRREKLLPNVIRSQFYARKTRPDTNYDLSLYHYEPKDENITFIWCIPDQETVGYFTGYYYVDPTGELHWEPPARPKKGEEQLAQFCKDFVAGTLI